MPYRDLPHSDPARLTALRRAKNHADGLPDGSPVAFSAESRAVLDVFLPQFETEYQERQGALAGQTAATAAVSQQVGVTRQLTRDLIAVLNMAIGREEVPASARPLYGLGKDDTTLPVMNTIDEVTTWAQQVVDGEAARVAQGGRPLDWPSAAQITAALASLQTLRTAQASASSQHDAEQEDVANLRVQADSLIRDIWDEVEFTYRRDDPPSLRRKARLYGVYYATRPGEPPEEDAPADEPPPEPQTPAA